MWFREVTFPRVVPVLFAMSVAALSGCGAGDEGTGRTTQMRCAQDGLCVDAVGKRSLEIGFRDGTKEVRLDCIYRAHSAQLHSSRPFACRLLDQYGEPFVTASGGDTPAAWSAFASPTSRAYLFSEEDEETRNALVRRMCQAMQEEGRPVDAADTAWQESLEQLQRVVQKIDVTLPDAPTERYAEEQRHLLPLFEGPAEEMSDDSWAETGSDASEEDVARDEWEAHQVIDEGNRGEDASSAMERATRGSSLHFDSFHGLQKENIDFAEYHEDSRFEYRQEIDLWNSNTRTFFFFGWPSKKHHSSADINVFRRPVGSGQPFSLFRGELTGNHGAKPHDKRMHLYARCRDFPVTKGYFAWKGECDGRWLTGHLCNDDTAYQIWHAYGGWNGGRHCVGKKRTHRPSCDKPW